MAEMGAAYFKAHCLQVMDHVSRTRQEVVITKRGVAVARLVPVSPPPAFRLGALAHEVEIIGDVTAPLYGARSRRASRLPRGAGGGRDPARHPRLDLGRVSAGAPVETLW